LTFFGKWPEWKWVPNRFSDTFIKNDFAFFWAVLPSLGSKFPKSTNMIRNFFSFKQIIMGIKRRKNSCLVQICKKVLKKADKKISFFDNMSENYFLQLSPGQPTQVVEIVAP